MRATRQVVAIHGGLDQEERHEAIRSFKEGSKVRGFLIFLQPNGIQNWEDMEKMMKHHVHIMINQDKPWLPMAPSNNKP